jgi:sec-independent protein translocase protein TatB
VADVNGGEMLVILFVAIVVIGPARLPSYAQQAGRWIRRARVVLQGLRSRVDDELGTDSVDWSALDPRQYDPRRVVRDALASAVPVRSADGTSPAPAPHRSEQGDSHVA